MRVVHYSCMSYAPFGWQRAQKMYAIMSSTDYVAALEPRTRQRYTEKVDIVGLPLEQHFLKHLEQPYMQQLTTMALSILYHG